MADAGGDFTIGIEEEYLLVDGETLDLAAAPDALMLDCARELDTQVSPEFLQCQIEVGTRVCGTVAEARADLAHLRRTIADVAARYGLRPLAVSCHPFADWHKQHFTDKERYRGLERDLAGVVRRMLICGMHVHVGIDDDEARIDLMGQFSYFLPHLLALSCSSPFWKGDDTGLSSYRLSVFDNLPRTGMPPDFASYSEFQRSVGILTGCGIIEDATKIWWDVRPSSRFPTLESRICDVSPRLDDAIAIAAMARCLIRKLTRLRRRNQRWRIYDRFLVGENRWRAQRYGTSEGLIDFGRREIVPFADLLEEMIELTAEDAAHFGCEAEVAHLRTMLDSGSSSDRQRAVFAQAIDAGADRQEALCQVVASLADEFGQGL
ncbi:carboxylate-amine ligase [Zhengella mangrovi]|uniref:Putative glutamate--cysteine ligase 2 n=1 Tax=Zhengella mangrovi TaxID=1982044 RepID=A0A2G1QPR9_9HYPH|nr:carboxylate-amine ligase [Zhengella mangrovi]PHP67513.1 carboxylate-amine ligase [Zhengella mangrovi]